MNAARTAVQLSPELAESHRALGWAALKAGLEDSSVKSFREALRLAPDDLDAELGQGAALSTMGEHRAAMASFQRAIAKAPACFEDYPELQVFVDASSRAIAQE
jgi:tetratricopeptide (TPR) repeat protein